MVPVTAPYAGDEACAKRSAGRRYKRDMPSDVPVWCEWRGGRCGLLVVAPHGGRRPRGAAGAQRKVNDLYTAELARELADRTEAALVANAALDRNAIDLNRLTQTARAAPWMFELCAELLEDLLDRHDTADVLLIHDWNAVQPTCDLGFGAALRGADAACAVPATNPPRAPGACTKR
jgi:hypothetical protein